MANRSTGPVQFKGIQKILKAYESKQIPCWAIWYGSNLFDSYYWDADDDLRPDMEQGKQLLKSVLTEVDDIDGVSTYTLKVYDGLKKGEKIKSNTPYDASFNFKLLEREESAPYRERSYRDEERDKKILELEAMVKTLTEKLNAEESEDEDEKPEGLMGMLGAVLKMPAVEQALAGAISQGVQGLMAKVMPINNPVPQALGRIAGVPEPAADSPADQEEKMQNALDTLYPLDPLLGDHLLKLAGIAEKNPGQYKMLIEMLNTML
jgi:hypothetical protein